MVVINRIDPTGLTFYDDPARNKGRREQSEALRYVPFIGVDGEGLEETTPRARYALLSVGDSSLYHSDSSELGFSEIMDFLYSEFRKHPLAIYVGYFLTYDFSKWLRGIPEAKALALFSKAGIARRKRKAGYGYMPVTVGGWDIDFHAGLRRFSLRPAYVPKKSTKPERTMYICDAGPFFQTSLIAALNPEDWKEPICTPEEYEIIRKGKEDRPVGLVVDEDMIRYNTLENRVLGRLMARTREGLQAIGIDLRRNQWYGPGQVAQAWLEKHKTVIPTTKTLDGMIDSNFLNAAQATYYGGWFEIFMHGHVPGVTYEYDVNSAYPHITSKLPCLLHGKTAMGVGKPPEKTATLRIQKVTITTSSELIGPVPYRTKNHRILRPKTVTGTYWSHELEAARKFLHARIKTYHSWYDFYQQCECPPPLADIADLYNQRLDPSIGKNTPHGKALKLTYVSIYGKTAQSAGSPTFANPIYASLITAGCRIRIVEAIGTHPTGERDLVMVATDGVYFRMPHPGLPESETKLGLWERKTLDNLTVMMPGLYWTDKARSALREGKKVRVKSRGVNAKNLASYVLDLDRQFRQVNVNQGRYYPGVVEWPEVPIGIPFLVISPQLALARGKWYTCGDTLAISRTITADPQNKRNMVWRDGDVLRSSIYAYEYPESTTYDGTFGRTVTIPELDLTIDSLDEAEAIVTPDGSWVLEVREALNR